MTRHTLKATALLAAGMALVVTGLAGCETTRIRGYSQRPIPPETRPLPPAPADARPNALVLTVGVTPQDTNGNGYPDLIMATVHLFDRRYAPALPADGAFAFALFAPGDMSREGAEPIRTWRVEPEQLEASYVRTAIGASYRFRLSLLESGTDRLPLEMGDLVGRYEPADGSDPVYAGEVGSIQLGQRVLIPTVKWREITEDEEEDSPDR